MRITHRNDAHPVINSCGRDFIERCFAFNLRFHPLTDKTDVVSLKTGPAHINCDRAVVFDMRTNDSLNRFAGNHLFIRQAELSHENRKAARAIAAHFDLAAAAIKDAVLEINVGQLAFFHHQQLIASHAVASIAQRTDLLAREHKRFLRGVEHDEVVACALHFCKSHS